MPHRHKMWITSEKIILNYSYPKESRVNLMYLIVKHMKFTFFITINKLIRNATETKYKSIPLYSQQSLLYSSCKKIKNEKHTKAGKQSKNACYLAKFHEFLKHKSWIRGRMQVLFNAREPLVH